MVIQLIPRWSHLNSVCRVYLCEPSLSDSKTICWTRLDVTQNISRFALYWSCVQIAQFQWIASNDGILWSNNRNISESAMHGLRYPKVWRGRIDNNEGILNNIPGPLFKIVVVLVWAGVCKLLHWSWFQPLNIISEMDPGFREMSIHTVISNGGSCPSNSREVDSCFVTCSDS